MVTSVRSTATGAAYAAARRVVRPRLWAHQNPSRSANGAEASRSAAVRARAGARTEVVTISPSTGSGGLWLMPSLMVPAGRSGCSLPAMAASPYQAPVREVRLFDVIDDSFRLYRRDFKTLLLVAAAVTLPTTVADLLVLSRLRPLPGSLGGLARGALSQAQVHGLVHWELSNSVIWVGVLLLAGIALILQWAALVRVAAERSRGATLGVRAAFAGARHDWLPLLGLGVLLFAGLLAGIAAVTVLAILFALLGAAGALLIALLILGALVLAMVVGVRMVLAGTALVIEGAYPWRALTRSWDLTRGSAWRVFGIVLVLYFATAIPGLLVGLVLAGTTGAGLNVFRRSLGADSVVSAALAVLTAPILPVGLVAAYFDARRRSTQADDPSSAS